MKANVEVELQPFGTPNYVRVAGKSADTAVDTNTAIALSALDSLTLDRLCKDFRAEVFKKAGRDFPPVAACTCGKSR